MSEGERGRGEAGTEAREGESPLPRPTREAAETGEAEARESAVTPVSSSEATSASADPPGRGGGGRGLVRAHDVRSIVSLPVVAALLLGMALAGGAGAWWMGERGGSAESAAEDGYCWGALSEKNVRWFLGGTEDRTSEELRADDVEVKGEESLLHSPADTHDVSEIPGAYCRVTAEGTRRAELDVTVKALDPAEAYGPWRRDHMHADLTSLAGGLPGMAGPRDAWIALPSECFSSRTETLLVSVVGARHSDRTVVPGVEPASPEYAHAAVSIANEVLEQHGCGVRFPVLDEPLDPQGDVRGGARPHEAREGCGLELGDDDLPEWISSEEVVGSSVGGPVHVCEVRSVGVPETRFVSVTNPALLPSVLPEPRPDDMRAVVVPCMQYELTVTGVEGTTPPDVEMPMTELLRKLAEQRAEERGCDPRKVREVSAHRLPTDGS